MKELPAMLDLALGSATETTANDGTRMHTWTSPLAPPPNTWTVDLDDLAAFVVAYAPLRTIFEQHIADVEDLITRFFGYRRGTFRQRSRHRHAPWMHCGRWTRL